MIIDRVLKYMTQHQMITKGEGIIVGVSGGADSICLLFVLKEISRQMSIRLYVVHVNHGIRGEKAEKDGVFVENICRDWQIPFYLINENVIDYATVEGFSVEEAGRILRYKAFEKIREECHATKIAVAHHKNDQAETVLFNLFRGSGIKGLGGINPVRDNIIRPLLCLERKEIEQFLEKKAINYCIDETNADTTYKRNVIRNKIVSIAEKEIQERVVEHIADTAILMQEAECYIYEEAKKEWEYIVTKKKSILYLEIQELVKSKYIIQTYLIRMCLEKLSGDLKDISARHITNILELLKKPVGKSISLPNDLIARRDYKNIVIYKKEHEENHLPVRVSVNIPGRIELKNGAYISFQIEKSENVKDIEQKLYTKWFDYDKIISGLLLRNREPNDFLYINSKMEKQSIKSYFINSKIPKDSRDKVLLLAEGSHILWVIGYRISEKCKISDETKNILKVQVCGGSYNE